jgi:dTDP-4-amino-4,6-dideoxygalactose transaminase
MIDFLDSELPLPVLIPMVPKPSEWVDLLEKSYGANTFTNNGPLAVIAEKSINEYLGPGIDSMVCSSNTAGLIASLIAMDLMGKNVIVSNNTFVATLNALVAAGCTPILADVNPKTWEIDVENVASITAKVKVEGLLFTRVHGFRRDITQLIDFCEKSSIKVLIDSAAAFPAIQNEYEEPINYLEVFSFHATKPLGIGEGGAVIGPKSQILNVRQASNFGLVKPSSNFGDGINAKLDEFACARLIAGISKFPSVVSERIKFAESIQNILEKCPTIEKPNHTGATSWPFFPIKFSTEDDLINFQKDLSSVVQTRRYYYPSLSKGYTGKIKLNKVTDMKFSEEIANTTLCLPVIPTIEKKHRDLYFYHLSQSIERFLSISSDKK